MHGSVEREGAGRGDPAAVGHVATELPGDLERERKPGRRAADAAEVDVDVDRQFDLRVLVDEDADHGARTVLGLGDRRDGDVADLVAAPHGEADVVARLDCR